LLEPHAFFQKHQFGALPQQFEHLKLEGSDLAYRLITKIQEEMKEEVGKREKKVKEKFDDGKSTVSTRTYITNKASNGTLKRHCQVCDKLITNWADHRKKVHNGEDLSLTQRLMRQPPSKKKLLHFLRLLTAKHSLSSPTI